MKTSTKIISQSGKEFVIAKEAVAHINPQNCVNCGKCREYCPVEAIEEQQRVICHVCPECTDKPTFTINKMTELSTERSCTTGCPLGISPQGYVNLVRAHKELKAFEHIWDKCPLPSVCGRICHHPCEQDCKRGIVVDEPIAIRGVKRYLSDNIDFIPEKYPEIYEECIAVVGAGPAGLTAAHYLASYGYQVTIFDEELKAGGMMQRGIPTFRLPREELNKDISRLENAGIRFVLGEKVGKAKMDALKKEYDAIVVATGAPNSKGLKINGWRAEGVMNALNFMETINNNQEVFRHPGQVFNCDYPDVVVIGGGAVAIDSARAAIRLGASTVTIACVECGENVPCHKWELDEAIEEGIIIKEGWAPKEFISAHTKLEGVVLQKVTCFGKDKSGKISFSVDDVQTEQLKADWVIVAVGQNPDSIWSEYENNDRIVFAGDVISQECSVVDSMASGKKAAMSIDCILRGRETKDTLALRVLNEAPIEEKIYPTNRLKIQRPDMPITNANERVNNFDEVETAYCQNVIDREVMRCLECGYQKVDVEKCIGCGVCQQICPMGNVITLEPIEAGGGKYE